MAWFIQPLQIADNFGLGIGRWRLTARSDEPVSGPFGLCDHEHATADEASACPEAVAASERF